MTYKICEWDDIQKIQVERDATSDEILEIEARKANTTQNTKDNLQLQINNLEAESMENRGARELHLLIMQKEAAEIAANNPSTNIETELAATPYYVRLKALDTQIRALRAEMLAL